MSGTLKGLPVKFKDASASQGQTMCQEWGGGVGVNTAYLSHMHRVDRPRCGKLGTVCCVTSVRAGFFIIEVCGKQHSSMEDLGGPYL